MRGRTAEPAPTSRAEPAGPEVRWRGTALSALDDAALGEAYRLTTQMLRQQLLEMQRRGMFASRH